MCCPVTGCVALILQYRTGTFEFQPAVLNPPGRLQGMEFSLTPLFNLAQPSLLLCKYMYETSIYKVKECDRPFDNYLDKS